MSSSSAEGVSGEGRGVFVVVSAARIVSPSLTGSPWPSMWRYMVLGVSCWRWLWSAVCRTPPSCSFASTAGSSSSVSTRSPIAIASPFDPPVPLEGDPGAECEGRLHSDFTDGHPQVAAWEAVFLDVAGLRLAGTAEGAIERGPVLIGPHVLCPDLAG